MVNSAASAYYYLRIVRTMYLDDAEDDEKIGGDIPVTLATALTATGVVVFGVAPWFLLKFAEVAVEGLAIG
jgi:NADH:ubiquinone oxidoreductase subunit 2 (subunit N)